jgi:hypothetical protein
VISVHDVVPVSTLAQLDQFRREFYRCLTAPADALFELTDALLCSGRIGAEPRRFDVGG